MKLSAIRVNSEAVEAGEWVDNIPNLGGVRLKVRGAGNADYKRMLSRLYAAVPRSDKKEGRVSPETAERIQAQCLAATVLQDWEGIEEDDGTPIKFDKLVASKLLSNPDYSDFRDAVAWAADQVGRDQQEALADTTKNSETPSAGN